MGMRRLRGKIGYLVPPSAEGMDVHSPGSDTYPNYCWWKVELGPCAARRTGRLWPPNPIVIGQWAAGPLVCLSAHQGWRRNAGSGSSKAKGFFLSCVLCVPGNILGKLERFLYCTFGVNICCLLWKYESQGELTMLEKQMTEKQIL